MGLFDIFKKPKVDAEKSKEPKQKKEKVMAHEISTQNGIAEVVCGRNQVPWHKLGTVVAGATVRTTVGVTASDPVGTVVREDDEDHVFVQTVPGAFRGSVTYHDSCSGLRELGVERQPRELLAKREGIACVGDCAGKGNQVLNFLCIQLRSYTVFVVRVFLDKHFI